MACDDDPATTGSANPRAEWSPSGPFLAGDGAMGVLQQTAATFRRARASLREPPELGRDGGVGGDNASRRPRNRVAPSSLVLGALVLPVVVLSVSMGTREASQEKPVDSSPIAATDPELAERPDGPGDQSTGAVEPGLTSTRVVAIPMPERKDASSADALSGESSRADRSSASPDRQLGKLFAAQPQLSDTERYILQDMAAARDVVAQDLAAADSPSVSSAELKASPQAGQISATQASPSAANSGLVTIQSQLPNPRIQPAGFPRPSDPKSPDQAGSTYSVQLSSVLSEAAARRASMGFDRDLAQVLDGLPITIERADLVSGTVFRVRVGAFGERARAEALCEQIREHETDCYVFQRRADAVPSAE
jgi:hypothetical protein